MARITAHIKPRPSDEKLKRAEARATEEREFARKDAAQMYALQTTHQEKLASMRRAAADWAKARATEIAAEVDALQTTHQERLAIGRTRSSERRHTRATEMAAEVDALRITQMEKKDAREAEEKRRVAKELVDRKARQEKINDEHMHTDEKKLEKLFEDQKEEARVQKAVDDAAEKDAVDRLSALTQSNSDAKLKLDAEVDALRTTQEEQARNRQEAASKKESEYTDMVDGHRRASQEWAEEHARRCAQAHESSSRIFAGRRNLAEDSSDVSDSDPE